MGPHKTPDDEHQAILKEVLLEKSPAPRRKFSISPYVTAIVILALMLLWLIPAKSFPPRAQINEIPSLSSLDIASMSVTNRPNGSMNSFIIIDANTKYVASNVVTRACSEVDKRCYAESLYYFVRDQIVYVSDPVHEYYELPVETLRNGAADCDGKSILLASLLQSVGIRTEFVYRPGHVYVQAWLPDKNLFTQHGYEWFPMDTTCTNCRFGLIPAQDS